MLKVCQFKEIKFFNSVSKKTFLKSNAVKGNLKNMMKSNGGIQLYHESENEGTCFSWWFFKQKYSEKKKLSCFKQVLRKRISHQEVFSRKGVLKFKTNHNGLYQT